jgi:hypothetical protein
LLMDRSRVLAVLLSSFLAAVVVVFKNSPAAVWCFLSHYWYPLRVPRRNSNISWNSFLFEIMM